MPRKESSSSITNIFGISQQPYQKPEPQVSSSRPAGKLSRFFAHDGHAGIAPAKKGDESWVQALSAGGPACRRFNASSARGATCSERAIIQTHFKSRRGGVVLLLDAFC
jgi:hypothetical protein